MVDGAHTGHRVRGRYRAAEQIEHAVGLLRRGEFLVLDCGTVEGGTVEDCYAQVRLTLRGVYDVEYRDGSPGRHFRTRTLSPVTASSVLAAWAGARPGWSTAFDWTRVESSSTEADGGAQHPGRESIYHLALGPNWAAAQALGEYHYSTGNLTLEEVGFIHACFADQIDGIAERFFALAREAPVALVIDEDKLPASVRVERAADADEFFPHIYGPLPVAAVSREFALRRDPGTGLHWRRPAEYDI